MRNVVFFALSAFACFVVFIVSLQKSLPSAGIFIYFLEWRQKNLAVSLREDGCQ